MQAIAKGWFFIYLNTMKHIFTALAALLLFAACNKNKESEQSYNTCGVVRITNQYTDGRSETARLYYNQKEQLDSVFSNSQGPKLTWKLIRHPQTGRINDVQSTSSPGAVLTYNDAGQLIKADAGNARMEFDYYNGKMAKATYFTYPAEAPTTLTPRTEFYTDIDGNGNLKKLTEKDLRSDLSFITTFEYTDLPNPCRDLGYIKMLAMAGTLTPVSYIYQNGFTGCFDYGSVMLKSFRKVVYNPRGFEMNVTEGTMQYTFDEKGRMVTSQLRIRDITQNITLSLDRQTYEYGCK